MTSVSVALSERRPLANEDEMDAGVALGQGTGGCEKHIVALVRIVSGDEADEKGVVVEAELPAHGPPVFVRRTKDGGIETVADERPASRPITTLGVHALADGRVHDDGVGQWGESGAELCEP
jgi:hypothetical protein